MKFDGKDPKQQRRITYITVVLVILVGMVSSFLRNDPGEIGYLTFYNEGYLAVMDGAGNVENIFYKDMRSVEYVESPDFGEPAGGSLTEEMRLGKWYSDQFGAYTNCTDVDLETCILIRTETGAWAISLESDETTRALHGAILDAKERILSEGERNG